MILGAIALLIVALALMAAELFLPSHGVLSVFAAITAVASVVLAARASVGLGMIFGGVLLLATPVVIYYAIKIYPQTGVGKRVMLDPRQAGTAGGTGFAEEAARLEALVGQQGVAMTMLRPAGSVEIGGRRIDAMSEADVIDAGTRVEVMQVSGLKVIVRAVG